jgi:hypothetical protein
VQSTHSRKGQIILKVLVIRGISATGIWFPEVVGAFTNRYGAAAVATSAAGSFEPVRCKSRRRIEGAEANVPTGYILISKATCLLEMGMWGGLPRPIALMDLKNVLKKQGEEKLSVGFGPWRQRAGESITRAAVEGKLRVYITSQDQQPVSVPLNVLGRLLTSRGYLRDRVIRLSLKACERDERLFMLLKNGWLVIKEGEFRKWYQTEYKKGRWPSQGSRLKPRIGRPTKQSSKLRNAILALVNEGAWNARASIQELRRLLMSRGQDEVASADTLARLVDELYGEMGDVRLRRVKRVRRKRPRSAAPPP